MPNVGALAGPDFGGLRKDLAPHLLSPSDSQDCMDTANFGDRRGVLGPRTGRARRYNTTQTIVGVVPYTFPWDTGRVICTGDGTWTVVSAPAAAGPAFSAFSGALALCDSIACSGGNFTTTTKTENYVAGLLDSVV